MRVFTLGSGFVANHLPYQKITEKLTSNPEFVRAILNLYKPNVVVNCIGFCGTPNVDQCESKKFETYFANVIVPSVLATECEKLGIHMIHIGSGCIYFGNSPNFVSQLNFGNFTAELSSSYIDAGWKETDFANPQSFYSKSKYACDLLLGQMSNVTTLRIRMPISDQDTSRNLINKLRNYKRIIDIPNSMTFMNDLVRCIEWVIYNRPGGIFHVVNPQPLTATRIMKEFQKYVPEHQFEYMDEQQLDSVTIAKRSNCILSTDKLQSTGFQMTNSEEALVKCMASYIKNMMEK